MHLDWHDLLYAIITALLGWLAGSLKPPPGTTRRK